MTEYDDVAVGSSSIYSILTLHDFDHGLHAPSLPAGGDSY